MQAILALEDGRIFRGKGYGAKGECYGEVVFNTSITGYQEIFTDPSYCGQIVVLTNPEIGNYGTNAEDNEATRPYIEGLIVREFSQSQLQLALAAGRRRISRTVQDSCAGGDRHAGAGAAFARPWRDARRGLHAGNRPRQAGGEGARDPQDGWNRPGEGGQHQEHLCLGNRRALASPDEVVGVKDEPARFHVVAYDFGIKQNILRKLRGEGCKVTVVPAQTLAEDVLALKPDGVFLSNGPGDPEPCAYAVDNIRRLMGRQPIFGICLGHQLTGIALGGKTFKLKFGHHGGNHPVKQLHSGKIEITAHNHNFAVDPDSLPQSEVELTHIDLNDGTLEGLRHRNLPLFCVQYHPEASPGPHDSHYLFKDFVKMMEEWKG